MLRNPEVVTDRLERLAEYVSALHRYRAMTCDEIASDIGHTWAVEHGLQLSIQCVIDVCDHLVAELGLGTPRTHPDAVELLIEAGILPSAMLERLTGMMRFRNVLVHAYARVDVRRVCENLGTGLDDFAEFARCVLEFLSRNGGSMP